MYNFITGSVNSSLRSIWFRQMSSHSVALITCPNSEVAESVANTLVTKKLAACVNIVPSVRSIYVWEGKIEKSEELLLIAKTQSKMIPLLTDTVKEIHPYECPEVISLNIEGGYSPYLKWITDSTS